MQLYFGGGWFWPLGHLLKPCYTCLMLTFCSSVLSFSHRPIMKVSKWQLTQVGGVRAACGRGCWRPLLGLLYERRSALHKRLVLSQPSPSSSPTCSSCSSLLLFLPRLPAPSSSSLLLLPVHPKVEQITTVFTAATRQKAWDHFSKAQRKNIDIWRKQCEVGTPSSPRSSCSCCCFLLLCCHSRQEAADRLRSLSSSSPKHRCKDL